MKLPNATRGFVEQEKIVRYLLDPAHPDNAGKAQFFFALGFTCSEWIDFAKALRILAQTSEVRSSMESAHGWKYVVDGHLETPSGKKPMVRTIWIVDRGMETPRLVTAYPREI
jgi:hypothetical protein